MSQTKHRLGVSEATLVRRKLKLASCEAANVNAAIEEIDRVFGMDSVSFDARPSILSLSYDASRTCLDCVEEILARHQVRVSDTLWMRTKQSFYHFVDQNVKENVNRDVHSCH